jgi:hypothetical protein
MMVVKIISFEGYNNNCSEIEIFFLHIDEFVYTLQVVLE